MKKINNKYYNIIAIIFLMMMALPSYSQNCTFADPQKQAEYDFLVELYNANPNFFSRDFRRWIDIVNGDNCDVCEIVTCGANGYIG